MSGISLTASMRSNLLSLQNISGQVSSTQNKLATGNKVNSAIDNPSSYYTALSLNNRADDLNALLDSMGQAVSTIKAATTALESATEFLEQASAVATQALETAKIPSKSFFEEKVGENGAVVTTAQELRDAVNSGKETICVYGAIDLDDISQTGGLTLQENQKLVGVGYFGNYDTDTNKFSSITATANVANNYMIFSSQANAVISDLGIDYTNKVDSGETYAIFLRDQTTQTTLRNLDIKSTFSSNNSTQKAAIFSHYNAQTYIDGKINIETNGTHGHGIYSNENSQVTINANAEINVKTTGSSAYGIFLGGETIINDASKINVQTTGQSSYGISFNGKTAVDQNCKINIQTTGQSAYGLSINDETTIGDKNIINIQTIGQSAYGFAVSETTDIGNNCSIKILTYEKDSPGISVLSGVLNIHSGTNLNIENYATNSQGILSRSNSTVNLEQGTNVHINSQSQGLCSDSNGVFFIEGNVYINTTNAAFSNNTWGGKSATYIASTAQIYIKDTNSYFINQQDGGKGPNIFDIAEGAKLAFEKDSKTEWYEVKETYHNESDATTTDSITTSNIHDKLNLESTSAWELPEKVEIDFEEDNSNNETTKQDLADAGKNYQEIINQYDALIKDAGYKGINLLQTEKLTVKFNETNTADLSVQGKDMSSQALGFTIMDWQTQGDIADSLAEIASALKSIRNYSAELGNNYSIITTRQDFTESLVNVLTEGADKLTLADMNEESANMLALQTRQQLAINSLSLASQASQSILKLF